MKKLVLCVSLTVAICAVSCNRHTRCDAYSKGNGGFNGDVKSAQKTTKITSDYYKRQKE